MGELLKDPESLNVLVKFSSVVFLSIVGMVLNHSVKQFLASVVIYKDRVDDHSKLLDRLVDLTERHNDYLENANDDIKELNTRVNQINNLAEKVAVFGEKIGELNRVIDKLTEEFKSKYVTKDELIRFLENKQKY